MIPVFIIKDICSEWDGCDGISTTESYTNWIFTSEDDANEKCKELQKKLGRRGDGYSRKFEVCSDYVIEPEDFMQFNQRD